MGVFIFCRWSLLLSFNAPAVLVVCWNCSMFPEILVAATKAYVYNLNFHPLFFNKPRIWPSSSLYGIIILRFFVSRWLTTNRLRENIKGLRCIRRAMRMEQNGNTRETQDAGIYHGPFQWHPPQLPTWILTGSPVWLSHTAITGITIHQISSPPGLWCGCIYLVATEPIVTF